MNFLKNKKKISQIFFSTIFIGGFYFFITLIAPPKNFPTPYQLSINSGQTLFSISQELKSDNVVKSPRIFEIFMIFFGNEKKISEGEFYFEKPTSSLQIAIRITTRSFGIKKTKITIPEGFSNKEISNRVKDSFPEIDIDRFNFLIKGKEGFLFPDTYNFFPNVTPEIIINTLEKNFSQKISLLKNEVDQSKRSLNQIIVMASIIEKEASGENDRNLISGILWNRFDRGIALQVDAPFLYLLGKESKNLTRSDLLIDSPYNTYLNKGLPPYPINNPGTEAIKAAINPDNTEYLYYLHGKDRNIYYAKTYSEHQLNIKKYLK